MPFFESDLFNFVVLPLLIFVARICDVSIGTLRIIVVSRGRRFLAPMLGFFEVLIWIIVIGRVMNNLKNPLCYIAYAGGFATGNYVGMLLEHKLAMGLLVVRVITRRDASELIRTMREKGFGVTSVPADGKMGRVHLLYSVVKRSDLDEVVDLIQKFNPKAFYSIEDVRYVNEGIFPLRESRMKDMLIRRGFQRKGK